MKPALAKRLLACHQPDHLPVEGKVRKAVQLASRDEDLRKQLEEQQLFDQDIARNLEQVAPPPDLRRKLAAVEHGPRPNAIRKMFKNPAIFAAALSVTVTLVLLGTGVLDRSDDFPGNETAIKIIDGARTMSGVELEPITPTELGKLGDWFALNGLDRFTVAAELSGLRAVGCRVFRDNGFTVGQAAVEKSNVLVYVFNAADLDVHPPKNGEWVTFHVEDWAAAICQRDGICTLLALHGSESEIEDLLASVK